MIRSNLGVTAFPYSLRCHQGRQTLLSLPEISSLGFRTVDDLFHSLSQDSVLVHDLRYFQQLFRHLRHKRIKNRPFDRRLRGTATVLRNHVRWIWVFKVYMCMDDLFRAQKILSQCECPSCVMVISSRVETDAQIRTDTTH